MIFTELPEPIEAFDCRTFESLPTGCWQVGISRMLFAKYRVGISLKGADLYVVSYWGGDRDVAMYLLGFVMGICLSIPETVTEQEIRQIFPLQNDKELDPQFWATLFKAGDRARHTYRNDSQNL